MYSHHPHVCGFTITQLILWISMQAQEPASVHHVAAAHMQSQTLHTDRTVASASVSRKSLAKYQQKARMKEGGQCLLDIIWCVRSGLDGCIMWYITLLGYIHPIIVAS